jgi:hypothetical protein
VEGNGVVMSDWVALGPRRFVDRRARLTRDSGIVYQHVGAYQGVVSRRGADGKQEIERCPHAHNKASAARKCAERAARRFNREEKR